MKSPKFWGLITLGTTVALFIVATRRAMLDLNPDSGYLILIAVCWLFAVIATTIIVVTHR